MKVLNKTSFLLPSKLITGILLSVFKKLRTVIKIIETTMLFTKHKQIPNTIFG